MSSTIKDIMLTLISDDSHLVRQLGYLFRVVLGAELGTMAEFPDLDGGAAPLAQAGLVLLHALGPAEKDLDRVKQLTDHNPRQIVIVIRDEGALSAAQAFVAGAVDVVTTPLELPEFASRVALRLGDRNLLGVAAKPNVTWDAEAFITDRAALTTAEAQVMRVLYREAGHPVTRDDLSYAIYGQPWEYGDRRFDVHIAKLRKKLSGAFGKDISVSTIRSSGYVLTIEDSVFCKATPSS